MDGVSARAVYREICSIGRGGVWDFQFARTSVDWFALFQDQSVQSGPQGEFDQMQLCLIRRLVSGIMFALLAATPILGRAADQQPLKVAIVGLEHGHVAGFLPQLPKHPDVKLVGIADGNTELWKEYENKFSLPESLFYKSEANMIEQTKPDAILVYTPIGEHRHAIEIAAQFGVSVMVEKPLTISLDDALAIRRVAREHKIHVLVNYETTWYPSNRAAYDEVRENRIGEIRRVVVHDGHEGPKEINVQPEFLKWLTDPEQNGAGALYDFGCYGVDLMTWLMNGETPLTVTAVVNHDKPQIYPRVDDDATIIVQYPRAQGVMQASWNWPFSRKDMEVYGANGYAITVASDHVRIRHQHDREEHLETAPGLPANEHDSLSYLAAVLHGQIQPKGDLSALDTNVTVMQILDAARESVRTGRTVKLNRVAD
jgi:predicted dehydrogenase